MKNAITGLLGVYTSLIGFVLLSVLVTLSSGVGSALADDASVSVTINAPSVPDFVIFSAVKINSAAVAAPGSAVLQFKDAVLPYAELTRKEPGCVEYRITQSAEDPTVFETYEYWASSDARTTHTAAFYYKQFFATVGPLMETGFPAHLVMTELK